MRVSSTRDRRCGRSPTESPGTTLADAGDVRDELHRRPQAVLEGVVVGRRQAVHGDAGAHHVEVGARPAQRRRAVGGVAEQAGVLLLELPGQLARTGASCCSKKVVSASSAVAKWLMRPDSTPPACACSHRVADLVRPHAEPAHAGVELDVHADAEPDGLGDERRRPGRRPRRRRAAARSSPVPVSGPKIRIGAVKPASRSSSASGAVATPSHVEPASSAARATGTAPCP